MCRPLWPDLSASHTPQPLVARVRQVDPGAFTTVSPLGLEEQRVPIVLDLVNERPATFGNGFHVNVDIEVWKGTDVVTIPSTALFRIGQDWAVFVIRDSRAHLTRVVAGLQLNGYVTVTEFPVLQTARSGECGDRALRSRNG